MWHVERKVPLVDWQGGYSDSGVLNYQAAVPLRVLALVERLQQAFPWATFFISDYQARNPDPFLALVVPDGQVFVVACWNEPGFAG